MFYRNAGSSCTGAIISKSVILTAAHCAEQDPWWWPIKLLKPSNVFVTFGHSDLGNAMNMSVKSILIHPNYGWKMGQWYNDLALLKLSNDLEFNDAIQPISLPSLNYTKYDLLFEELIFAGYGSEKFNTEEGKLFQGGDASKNFRTKAVNSMKKLKVDLTMSTCNDHLYQVMDEKYDSLLFSSTHGLWFGDSGGPLMIISPNFTNPEVIGVAISAIITNHNEHKVDIYTRVSFFVPWIQKNLENFDGYTNLNLDWTIAIGILILELTLVLLLTALFTLLVLKFLTKLTKARRK